MKTNMSITIERARDAKHINLHNKSVKVKCAKTINQVGRVCSSKDYSYR